MSELSRIGLIIGIAIFLRCCTSHHPYSGQGKPPMFGDYEAQRHWQEITLNLPIDQWYKNTTNNDLLYWGLDYPPLTAFHSLLLGKIAESVNKSFIELHKSRGFESTEHKYFMRLSVLVTDCLIYIPAIVAYFFKAERNEKKSRKDKEIKDKSINNGKKHQRAKIDRKSETDESSEPNSKNLDKMNRKSKNHENLKIDGKIDDNFGKSTGRGTIFGFEKHHNLILSALLYPGIILIDYGHFQYNSISLGFFIIAVIGIFTDSLVFSSFFFVLALNYKQMELYHALPFFFYILGVCWAKLKNRSLLTASKLFISVSLTVVFTFFVIWLPFVRGSAFIDVLTRLFPVDRGVFEDKVANVYCVINVVIKLKKLFTNYELAKICLTATIAAVSISNIDLLLRPTKNKFLLSLINTSLGFYLFSFQVHEKSILLVSIPVLLYFSKEPFVCYWFLLISIFSMLPLLIKDGLFVAYCASMIFYAIAVNGIFSEAFNDFWENKSIKLRFIFHSSVIGVILLSICSMIIQPPARYPDLFPLLVSVYSCAHFFLFFIYFNFQQIFVINSNQRKIKPK